MAARIGNLGPKSVMFEAVTPRTPRRLASMTPKSWAAQSSGDASGRFHMDVEALTPKRHSSRKSTPTLTPKAVGRIDSRFLGTIAAPMPSEEIAPMEFPVLLGRRAAFKAEAKEKLPFATGQEGASVRFADEAQLAAESAAEFFRARQQRMRGRKAC